jgi:hypothetical protein
LADSRTEKDIFGETNKKIYIKKENFKVLNPSGKV